MAGLIAALLFSTLGLIQPIRAADDDAALRKRALALNDVTGDDPIKGEINALVQDSANTKKLLAAAQRMAKENDQVFSYNAAFILARAALQLKELGSSLEFYKICADQAGKLQSSYKLVQACLGMMAIIDLLYVEKKYEESSKLSQEFLELLERQRVNERFKEEVLRRMIQALTKQGKTGEAGKLINNLLKAREKDWRNLRLKAWFEYETDHPEEAAKLYEAALGQVPKDDSLEKEDKVEEQAQLRYILSAVYVDLDKIDKAVEHLKALLALEPNNSTFNNDLGYIWADHDQNLDEAERMIRKALDEDRKKRRDRSDLKPDEDKDNAAYLDSLGWVLFKKKKFQDAKKYLLEAIKDKEGQHIEIYDHLGDAHMALGEKGEALAIWKKALEIPATSKREQQRKAQVEKKLKAKP
jgi:tetratricopeptide (TPR) repeat protein